MNLAAGMILIDFPTDADGKTPTVLARVLIDGSVVASFGMPLDPGLLDPRQDVADVAARAADAFVAMVRDRMPYPLEVETRVQITNVAAEDPDRFVEGMAEILLNRRDPPR